MAFKLNTIIICIILPVILKAEEVDIQKIEKLSNNFLTMQETRISHALEKVTPTIISSIDALRDPQTSQTLGYIVKISPKGFIVTSSDTDIEPIIAYSFSNYLVAKPDSNNILLDIIINDIQLRRKTLPYYSDVKLKDNNIKWAEYLEKDYYSLKNNFQQWPEEGTTQTGGWIDVVWGEFPRLKKYCPFDPYWTYTDGTRCRCSIGCVGMSMAMIIDYHKYINFNQFNESDAYVSKEGTKQEIKIDADSTKHDFPSFHKLNILMDSLEYKYNNHIPTTFQTHPLEDLAPLCFACGVSVKTNYGAQGSGSSILRIDESLKDKFNYFSATQVLNDLGQGLSEDFYTVLKSNMMNGLPAILTVVGSPDHGAHAIACDGYNTDEFFHLNFGSMSFAGAQAWYSIPQNMPLGYDIIQSGIIDIIPFQTGITDISLSKNFINLGGARIGNPTDTQSFFIENNNYTSTIIQSVKANGFFQVSEDGNIFSDSLNNIEIGSGQNKEIYIQLVPNNCQKFNEDLIIKYKHDNNAFLKSIGLLGYGVPENATVINQGQVFGEWTKSNSPYFICGDIEVRGIFSLKIDPGVELRFYHHSLTVGKWSKLSAVGTENDSIIFTAADTSIGWLGIDFLDSYNDDTLSYCKLTYGKVLEHEFYQNYFQNGAIYSNNSSPNIFHCQISNNISTAGAGISCVNSNPKIINCNICNNLSIITGNIRDRCTGGVSLNDGSAILINNIITNNTHGGIALTTNSSDQTLHLYNNIIINNSSEN
ncbi:C10 family peptidase, partial [candidate division KSB1 bacterium]|nr:C10 family peptidase [candidate division KSB1 bacterium]